MYNHSPYPSFLVKIWHCVMIGFAILQIMRLIFKEAIGGINNPVSYGITEFLVNYQGGFVRRGLIGELLYTFTTSTGIDCRWLIVPFCTLTLVLLLFVLWRGFTRNNLCWWLLVFNFSLCGIEFIRKDSCMLVIAAAVLFAYTKIKSTPLKLTAVNLLLILGLNIHECTFFIIGIFAAALVLFDPDLRLSFIKRCIALFPIILMMGCLSIYHGNETIARDIFNSLTKIYPNDFCDYSKSATIESIAWSTEYAIHSHIVANFLEHRGIFHSYWVKPMIWVATFFLSARLPFILQQSEGQTEAKSIRTYLIVLVFQWFAMLPLLTVLHGDNNRALAYWGISSLLIYFILPAETIEKIAPQWYKTCIAALQKALFQPKLIYIIPLLMCTTAAPFFGFQPRYLFSHSLIGTYHYFIKDIILWVTEHL